MQFARHALTFGCDGEVFDAGGVFGELAVGGFKFVGEGLRFFTSFGLTDIERDVHADEDDDGDDGEEPVDGAIEIGEDDEIEQGEGEEIECG